MTAWRPDLALDRLTKALEVEILTAPEPEVRNLARRAMARTSLDALRAFVERAVEAAEGRTGLPPQDETAPALRRS